MKKILYLVLFLLTLSSVYLSSFSVLHKEVNFFNDVSRDFLLLQELDQKKIVFIGPRSNISGLFHGPLWTYMNYPAYVVGKGDPVFVAWSWIFLEVAMLLTGFYIGQKLFGKLAASAYVLLLSLNLVTHINGMFHSEATYFFMPVFIYTIALYFKTKKGSYLLFHLVTAAILIQLNIGVGVAFLTLSLFLTSWVAVKNKKWKHLFSFFLIPLLLSNFIIFDLRHDFIMTQAVINSFHGARVMPFIDLVENRLLYILGLELIQNGNTLLLLFIFAAVMIYTIRKIRDSQKQRYLYIIFLYYYFGYMALSFINNGVILGHMVYLLVPLTALWFVSFLEGKYIKIFLPLLAVAVFFNFQFDGNYINYLTSSFMDKNYDSWRALTQVAQKAIARQQGKPFGYYVFSPAAFAYGQRYSLIYYFQVSNTPAYEYTKMPTTYVFASPPPGNDPYMTYVWWVKNPVGIKSEPVWKEEFASGFTLLEYQLSPQEQKVPHDKTIELGIHFR